MTTNMFPGAKIHAATDEQIETNHDHDYIRDLHNFTMYDDATLDELRDALTASERREEHATRALTELRTIRMPDMPTTITRERNIRPRRLRRRLAVSAALIVLAGAGIGFATRAEALPGQCGGGYGAGSGGEFCDYDAWPDGSFMHRERVCVLGFCGTNTFRACHVPGGRVATDNDPATPC